MKRFYDIADPLIEIDIVLTGAYLVAISGLEVSPESGIVVLCITGTAVNVDPRTLLMPAVTVSHPDTRVGHTGGRKQRHDRTGDPNALEIRITRDVRESSGQDSIRSNAGNGLPTGDWSVYSCGGKILFTTLVGINVGSTSGRPANRVRASRLQPHIRCNPTAAFD